MLKMSNRKSVAFYDKYTHITDMFNSDVTLASFRHLLNRSVCHTFLMPDFSGARNRCRVEHVQFWAENQPES